MGAPKRVEAIKEQHMHMEQQQERIGQLEHTVREQQVALAELRARMDALARTASQ